MPDRDRSRPRPTATSGWAVLRSPRSTSGRVRLTCLPLRVEARSRRWQRTELGSGQRWSLDREKHAELWHVVNRRVVSRIPIDATWVGNVAVADGALVVVPYRLGEARPTAFVVGRGGKLTPIATLAKDNHNILGTRTALWAVSYRRKLVTEISEFAVPTSSG